jgi:hypothetical protein
MSREAQARNATIRKKTGAIDGPGNFVEAQTLLNGRFTERSFTGRSMLRRQERMRFAG